ncbi:unnamed protein product, partial [Urochloa humidicola]
IDWSKRDQDIGVYYQLDYQNGEASAYCGDLSVERPFLSVEAAVS